MQICFQENNILCYIKSHLIVNAIPKLILIKDTYFGDISPDNSPPITVDLTKLKQCAAVKNTKQQYYYESD